MQEGSRYETGGGEQGTVEEVPRRGRKMQGTADAELILSSSTK